MKTAIYVPTHERPEFAYELAKNLLEITKGEIPIYFVMDEDQVFKYKQLSELAEKKYQITLLRLLEKGRQIGFARYMSIQHAQNKGYTHIIMTDDDVKLPNNLLSIFDRFRQDGRLGWAGTYFGFYGVCKIKPRTGVQYSSSVGYMTIALDIAKVLEVGNYNPDLHTHEDNDLAIKLMRAGYYCAVDTEVISGFKNVAMAQGGCSSHGYLENEKESREKLIKIYGNFFGMRKGKCFCQWVKMKKAGFFPEIDFNQMAQYQKVEKKI